MNDKKNILHLPNDFHLDHDLYALLTFACRRSKEGRWEYHKTHFGFSLRPHPNPTMMQRDVPWISHLDGTFSTKLWPSHNFVTKVEEKNTKLTRHILLGLWTPLLEVTTHSTWKDWWEIACHDSQKNNLRCSRVRLHRTQLLYYILCC